MTSGTAFSWGWRWFALCLALAAGLMATARSETNQPLVKLWRVREAGRICYSPELTNFVRGGVLRLSGAEHVEFTFSPVDAAKDYPLRLRRKLDGRDRDWREAGGEIQVLVLAHGESGRVLSYSTFRMVGESEGWRGAVENSEFHLRRESLTLPAGARRLEVLLIAADWNVLGTAAITDFRVLRADITGKTENIWPDPNVQEGTHLESPDGQPRYWTRGSFGASMARVLTLAHPAQGHALVISDQDVHLSPSWQAELPLAGEARGGETLLLEWREAFSVGIGGRQLAIFDALTPGDYIFRARAVTPAGEPIGPETALAFSIPQVFWKRPAVVGSSFTALALAVMIMVRAVTRRRLQAHLDQLELRRRHERERRKIAQDIHDDLGASLTHISLLGQTAHEKMGRTDAAWEDTNRLRTLTANLTQKLDEIVWAISPRHDTVESLFSYLTDHAEEFLGAAGVRTRIYFPIQLPNWALSPELRHDVFLATKESLNNIVKHAQASEVHLRLVILPGAFQLTIEDNGDGFSPGSDWQTATATSRRDGLNGLRERIESLGGSCSIDSTPGKGTRVVLTVPVDGATSGS